MTIRFLSLSCVFVVMSTAAAAVLANTQLNGCVPLLRQSENVVATLKDLLRERILRNEDLDEILKFRNPFDRRRDHVAEIYRLTVASVIEHLTVDETARVLVKKLETETKVENVARENTVIVTKNTMVQMRFYDIAPGDFWMGSPEDEPFRSVIQSFDHEPLHHVIISKGFRIANIPVTQWQYAMVTGENPAVFDNGPETLRLQNLLMQPENPVEKVSWLDAQEFIKKLNLLSDNDSPIVYQIIANHIAKKHYRLPTEAEWEFVVRGRGQWREMYPLGIHEKSLDRYAWSTSNAQQMTHPVAQLEPLLVDGDKPIFDLLGNVSEWCEDAYDSGYGLTARQLKYDVVDPRVGPEKSINDLRIARGGGYSEEHGSVRSASRGACKLTGTPSWLGFRLVGEP